MNANKKRIIAVICLLVFIVGVFVACKKNDEEEKLVSVSTDENGSLYYTDPTYEVDGIEYGGETHFVKPEETNKNGEYKIGDVTSEAYTTDGEGNVAPVTTEPSTTAPDGSTTTTSSGGGNNNTSTTDKSTTGTTPGGNDKTTNETPTSDNGTTNDQTSDTQTTQELSTAGINSVVDDNKLSNDGVINAW